MTLKKSGLNLACVTCWRVLSERARRGFELPLSSLTPSQAFTCGPNATTVFWKNVFDLQDEITATIVAAIHPELETAERERARVKSASDLDAWDCCQRGMWYGYVFDSENSEKAERCFNDALAIAPQYAPALTGLSWLDFQRVILGYANREPISRDDLIERGLQRASAATRADDRDAFAQYVFGRLLSIKGEFDEAIERLKRAISFNPNYALAYHGLGYAYAFSGISEKAVAQFDTALRLSPRDSYRWAFLTMRAFALVMCGDYEDAIECGTACPP